MRFSVHSFALSAMRGVVLVTMFSPLQTFAHEIGQRVGGYKASDGESRSMAQMRGRANAPKMASGSLETSLSMSANIERVRVERDANTKYMSEHFPDGQRFDRNFGIDSEWTLDKRTDVSFGGGVSGDGLTKTTTKRASAGQWFLDDQLRVGVFGSSSETRRPESYFLDYDSSTIVLRPRVVSQTAGMALKGILNPTTIVNAEYSRVQSTERPDLHAWTAGVRQHIVACDCAVHGEVGRVVNLGDLDTNMSSGELTGSQWSVSYLQSLWRDGHGRLSYRYAREDEFTRAYGDHLVFGSDSYTAAISHEFQKAWIQGKERPLLMDVAATRYLHNHGGAATTMEMGAGVKF